MIRRILIMLKLVGWSLRGLWYLLVIATPALGFWLASSLAAYLNGPLWAAALAGVLAFPVLPLAWEAFANWRRQKKAEQLQADGEEVRARVLTLADRVILRTLAVNLTFLGVLGGLFPQQGFTALSTRGDWMLAERSEAWAEQTRDGLFAAAGGLEWLYNATRDNPYERWADEDDGDDSEPAPVAGEVERTDDEADDESDEKGREPDERSESESDEPASDDLEADDPETDPRPDGPPGWPLAEALHPAVAELPEAQEKSPASVARYIAARERDPYLRVKALYDYAADRLAYDAPALARGEYPPQDAQTVFETRKAVCAGYAKLLVEMAEAIDINMVYVTGVSRDIDGNVGGQGHAWNAVEIEGKWYLIDATWGAGFVEDDQFNKRYTTKYLFTPPEVFGVDHFPDKEKWQLRQEPITRGEFMRQPVLRAAFFQRGFELIDPRRSQISVEREATIRLERPRNQHLIASLDPKGGGESTRCDVRGSSAVSINCKIPRSGTYDVRIFANDTRAGSYEFIGKIEANAR